MIRFIVFLLPLLLILPARGETITVSAAISLKESLTEISKTYEKATGGHVTFNFDASGKLAAQIRQGAPVDVFISADNEQMDKLAGAVDKSTRRVIADNTLVLIAPTNGKDAPKDFADLAKDNGQKIAIGEPRTVPAGHYAIQVFKSLKIDQVVTPRLVYGESVRTVLTYVEQNEVCAGIVYGTDAKLAGDKVRVIATADPSTHDVIEYPAAVVTSSQHVDAAKKFLDYLRLGPAKTVLTRHGFISPNPSPTTRPSP